MIKRIFLSMYFLVHVINCASQGITNLWYMGYDSYAGVPWGGTDFNFSINPLSISYNNRKMNFRAANASICDTAGNMLFYTNGLWIANANNDTMLNGSGLNPGPIANDFKNNGHPISQMIIILPKPDDFTKFFVFHEAMDYGPVLKSDFFYYTVIDLNSDSGRGEVITKNNIFFQDSLLGGEITAVKHGNGRDWWIVTHCVLSQKYSSVLLTPNGIHGPFNQSIGNIRTSGTQSCFSPEGNKYAHYDASDDLEIFDFDRCTGLFSNPVYVAVNDSQFGGGVSFSPNGRFVYCSSGRYVYQFDTWSANIASSKVTVAIWDSTYSPSYPFAAQFYLMQLAPDGKIYINTPSGTLTFHTINSPDSLGLACDLQQHSVPLPTYNARTIPNHPNYFLGRDVGSPCDSLTPVAEIKNNSIPIRINPNPAQNTFYLNYELPYGQNATATVYNTLGKAVMKKSLYWYFKYLQVDCSAMENGVYTIKVENGELMGATKFVVLR